MAPASARVLSCTPPFYPTFQTYRGCGASAGLLRALGRSPPVNLFLLSAWLYHSLPAGGGRAYRTPSVQTRPRAVRRPCTVSGSLRRGPLSL